MKTGFASRYTAFGILALFISFSYANLTILFLIQHFTSTFYIALAYLILTSMLLPFSYRFIRFIHRYLSDFSKTLYIGFVSAVIICGAFFYIFGPVDFPSSVVLQAISAPLALDHIIEVVTIITVGASGLAFLLIKSAGRGAKRISDAHFILFNMFFIVYLSVGLFIYGDYGIGIDERIQRQHSLISMNHIIENVYPNSSLIDERLPYLADYRIVDLNEYPYRFYPVIFQLPLVFIELLNDFDSDVSSVWLYRHFVTFLFFFCGVLAFYRLAYEKFLSWKLALIGASFLVVTPHIFGQSFNQIKDTVFLSAFTINLYLGFRYWRHKTILSALLFGLFTAFASNIRVVAFFIIPFVFIFTLSDFISKSENRRKQINILFTMFVVLATYIPLNVLFFPASWSDPVRFNFGTLSFFSDYALWDNYIPYMGEWIRGRESPWHYLPVWMMLTIPLTYQILFAVGFLATVRLVISKKGRLPYVQKREEFGFLVLFLLPVIALILLGSTLYTDWRQFYFLYTPFLLVALYGLKILFVTYRKATSTSLVKYTLTIFFVAVGLYQGFLLSWMVYNHPYQNLFRVTPVVELLGGREGFDHDISRASVRQGLEFILSFDERDLISVCGINGANGNKYIQIFDEQDRNRINWLMSCDDGAEYVINGYRNPFFVSDLQEIYAISVDGLVILSVHYND